MGMLGFFIVQKKGWIIMRYDKEIIPINEKLYKKLFNLCNFKNVKLDVINGIAFKVKDTNINFIEPHRFIISINNYKLILLCYDNINLYLFDKEVPITVPIVSDLISKIKEFGGAE